SEPLGKSQVLEYLKNLSVEHEMYLHTFEKDISGAMIDEIQGVMDAHNIKWSYQSYNNKFGLLSTLIQVLSGFFEVLKKVKKHGINVIHARSNIPVLIALLVKVITGTKVLFDIRGFQIDEKTEIGRIKNGGIIYKLLKEIETSAYKYSDAIVSLTYNAKEIISRVTDSDKISVISTCANSKVFKFERDDSFKRAQGYQQNEKVIIHAGTVSNWYDFDSELLLIRELMAKDKNIQFLILNKNEHEFILAKLNEFSIDQTRAKIKEVDFYQMSKYLSFAHASIFIIKPTYSKRASAPTKFAENLCCHLFSITNNDIGDMNGFITKYPEVGFSFDISEIKTNVKQLSSDLLISLDSYNKESNQFQTLYEQHFSGEQAVKDYSDLYVKLVKTK
ncbi:hypothetical protein AB6D24_17225, partial [Vibrio splendidus]